MARSKVIHVFGTNLQRRLVMNVLLFLGFRNWLLLLGLWNVPGLLLLLLLWGLWNVLLLLLLRALLRGHAKDEST